jgi:hypothetical protein
MDEGLCGRVNWTEASGNRSETVDKQFMRAFQQITACILKALLELLLAYLLALLAFEFSLRSMQLRFSHADLISLPCAPEPIQTILFSATLLL